MNISTDVARTPRIRTDLIASSVEDRGVHYYDVKDPRTNNSMRLYHFEWLVAQQMNGVRTFDEVAAWARAEFGKLGWEATSEDLVVYGERLRELGMIDVSVAEVVANAIDELPLASSAPTSQEMPFFDDNTEEPRAFSVSEALAPPSPSQYNADELELPYPSPTAAEVLPKHKNAPARNWLARGIIFVMLGLAVVLGLAWYLIVPRLITVSVAVQAAPVPSTIVRYYESTAPLTRSEPQLLSFSEEGKIIDVVAVGTEVKPGTVLATLEAYTVLARELADVRDRQAHYIDALRLAESKGNANEIKLAQQKVAEKRRLIEDLQNRVAKSRLVATSPGLVDEVMVKVGDLVTAPTKVLRIVDSRLQAIFRLTPVELAQFKVGVGVVVMVRGDGGKVRVGAKVVSIEGSAVTIELEEDANGALKSGDTVRLERSVLSGIMRVPAGVLVKNANGVDQVFVADGGKTARLRNVTVVERSDNEALLSAGLDPGEQVIVNASVKLHDGSRIKISR